MSSSEQNASPAGASPTEDLEDLFENAPCGYLSMQPGGIIVNVNATLSAWTGFPKEALLGRRLHDFLNIAGRIFFETHISPLLRMQGFFNEMALDFITASGGRLPVLANAVERRDENGQVVFIRLTVFQASDRRRYERELIAARAVAVAAKTESDAEVAVREEDLKRLREISELREQFIAVLGHDLRNPLASISGGVHMLLSENSLSERGTLVLGLMQQSVMRMSGLIDNVLDFARGRLGGGLTLNCDDAKPLEPVLAQIVAELRSVAPERVIKTEFDLPQPVNCDRMRIGQLVSNLLGNAITHGAADKPIQMKAAIKDGMFELYVANAGPPIPPAAMEKLFQPFFRGEHRPSQQGLGLGLHIASEIAKAHAGTLTVTSTGEETRFTLLIPLVPIA